MGCSVHRILGHHSLVYSWKVQSASYPNWVRNELYATPSGSIGCCKKNTISISWSLSMLTLGHCYKITIRNTLGWYLRVIGRSRVPLSCQLRRHGSHIFKRNSTQIRTKVKGHFTSRFASNNIWRDRLSRSQLNKDNSWRLFTKQTKLKQRNNCFAFPID